MLSHFLLSCLAIGAAAQNCGSITNQSGYTIRIATNMFSGPDQCNYFNLGGGPLAEPFIDPCTYLDHAPGATYTWCGNSPVAFTFNPTYPFLYFHALWQGDSQPIRIRQGAFARIEPGQKVVCSSDDGRGGRSGRTGRPSCVVPAYSVEESA
ncbi:hypothetical protein K402DRAFT_407093 [Aulographum hederae CBS 113979]|uniref:Uncharacterized protein n=1 Tax=Aulographum hederae CBS 113979 TaxID=1176131 RepID=A0A6G1GQZ5_9PEZI|nr:hypothetical protein K402DRAFT_407093 [Aulographum hederae CBS 113979]